jgi:hypothetical protein
MGRVPLVRCGTARRIAVIEPGLAAATADMRPAVTAGRVTATAVMKPAATRGWVAAMRSIGRVAAGPLPMARGRGVELGE